MWHMYEAVYNIHWKVIKTEHLTELWPRYGHLLSQNTSTEIMAILSNGHAASWGLKPLTEIKTNKSVLRWA